jgi:hypothetical protein
MFRDGPCPTWALSMAFLGSWHFRKSKQEKMDRWLGLTPRVVVDELFADEGTLGIETEVFE